MCAFPVELKHGGALPSCFSTHTVSKYPFWSLFSAMFFIFLSFLLRVSLFKMPRHSTKVLPHVPEHGKAVRRLSERMYVLEVLHSGMSSSAVGYEFSVNESTIYIKYILNKVSLNMGFPGGTNGKEPTSQCRRCKRGGFSLSVGKIP